MLGVIVDGNVTTPRLYFRTVHESFQLTRLLADTLVIYNPDNSTVNSCIAGMTLDSVRYFRFQSRLTTWCFNRSISIRNAT